MNRLLLVDDDPLALMALKATLGAIYSYDLRIETFEDPTLALARVREAAFDVILSDYRMPEMDGIQFLRAVCGIQPHVVRIMLSAASDFEMALRAINEVEVYRYLPKPWKDADLLHHVSDALKHAEAMHADRVLADAMRLLSGALTPAEMECRRLEELEPGLTVVEWGPNGEVLMPDELIEFEAHDRH
jgi:two-component system probable response regulator PhcQ